jgi:hypothetical protein
MGFSAALMFLAFVDIKIFISMRICMCRPSAPRWRQVLQENVPGLRGVSLEAETSPVHELLNLAWGGHEIVSDYTDDMFSFFERPGPDEAELMPIGGISASSKIRGGASWAEDKGISGRRL